MRRNAVQVLPRDDAIGERGPRRRIAARPGRRRSGWRRSGLADQPPSDEAARALAEASATRLARNDRWLADAATAAAARNDLRS